MLKSDYINVSFFYSVFNVLYITPVYFCDLRAAAGSTDGKSERESSLH